MARSAKKKPRFLEPQGGDPVIRADAKALRSRLDEGELAYLTQALANPEALKARLALHHPGGNADRIVAELAERRRRVAKALTARAERLMASPAALYSGLPDPLPQGAPGGNGGIQPVAGAALAGALADIGLITGAAANAAAMQAAWAQGCGARQGRILTPGAFHVERGTIDAVEGAGAIAYSLDDGVLPFRISLDSREIDRFGAYFVQAEIGFRFPAPLCDSILTWDYELRAFAGLALGAERGWLWLDHLNMEQRDLGLPPGSVTFPVVGSVLDLSDSTSGTSTPALRFSGSYHVPARRESAFWTLCAAHLAAIDGTAFADGFFQLYAGSWGGFSPGIRYRFDPVVPPT